MKFSLGAVLALAATAIAGPMDIEARARTFYHNSHFASP